MAIQRILLAEDDPFIRRVSEASLRRAGFTVSSVGDGHEAVHAVRETPFDVVLLDGLMPTMDGLEACRQIKADPRTAPIPVIMLSARTEASDEEEGLAAGASGYIRKPFDATTLGHQILTICSSAPTVRDGMAPGQRMAGASGQHHDTA